MSKDEEITLKELLLSHIEDSKEYRKEMITTVERFHSMTIEELKALKVDVERFNDIESKGKWVVNIGKWFIKLMAGSGFVAWLYHMLNK